MRLIKKKRAVIRFLLVGNWIKLKNCWIIITLKKVIREQTLGFIEKNWKI